MNIIKTLLASLLLAGCAAVNGSETTFIVPGLSDVVIEVDYATSIEQDRDGVWSATRATGPIAYPFFIYMTIQRLSAAQAKQVIEVEIKTIKPDKTSTSAKRKAAFEPNIDRFFIAQGPYEKEHVDMYGNYFFVFLVNGVEVGWLELIEGR